MNFYSIFTIIINCKLLRKIEVYSNALQKECITFPTFFRKFFTKMAFKLIFCNHIKKLNNFVSSLRKLCFREFFFLDISVRVLRIV